MKNSGIEWVGDIPDDWNIIKIKYVLQERVENNSPIRTKNILSLTAQQGVVPIAEKTGGGNKPKEDYSDYRLAYPGDIVMNSMNILSGSVGLSKYFGCVSPVYYMLRPRDKNFDVRFFNYIFQSTVFQKSLYGLGNGILMKESGNGKLNTIRMRIPMDKFGSLYIPVAPVEEQKRIAEFLDKKCGEIDGLIADIKTQVQTLEQYKRSVITEAVTKGLNPSAEMKDSEIEWVGDIPANWDIHPLYYFFDERKNKNSFGKENNLLSLSYGKIIRKDINSNGGLLPENFNGYNIVEPNDIVLRLTDLQNDKRSLRTGFVKERGIITSAYVALKAKVNILPEFFYYELHVYDLLKVLYNLGNGVRQGLNYSELSKLKLFAPDLSEQQEIVNYIREKESQVDELISTKQSQIEALESYKKSLIYEYVTGKKEVV